MRHRNGNYQVLADFIDDAEVAEEFAKDRRTKKNWANSTDGLPVVKIGGKRWFHVPTLRRWLMARLEKRAPRRRAGQYASGAALNG